MVTPIARSAHRLGQAQRRHHAHTYTEAPSSSMHTHSANSTTRHTRSKGINSNINQFSLLFTTPCRTTSHHPLHRPFTQHPEQAFRSNTPCLIDGGVSRYGSYRLSGSETARRNRLSATESMKPQTCMKPQKEFYPQRVHGSCRLLLRRPRCILRSEREK